MWIINFHNVCRLFAALAVLFLIGFQQLKLSCKVSGLAQFCIYLIHASDLRSNCALNTFIKYADDTSYFWLHRIQNSMVSLEDDFFQIESGSVANCLNLTSK